MPARKGQAAGAKLGDSDVSAGWDAGKELEAGGSSEPREAHKRGMKSSNLFKGRRWVKKRWCTHLV